jgi:hypothetical protein
MHGRHGGAGRRETRDIWSGLVVGAGEARRCIDTSASGGIQPSTEGLRGQGRFFWSTLNGRHDILSAPLSPKHTHGGFLSRSRAWGRRIGEP